MIALWMANCRVGITQLSATLLDRRCPLRVLADMTANLGDVRFAPNSGHQADIARSPLTANTGSGQLHSITLSASRSATL